MLLRVRVYRQMQNKIHDIRFPLRLGYAWDELVCTKCHPTMSESPSVYSSFYWQHLKVGWKACCQREGEGAHFSGRNSWCYPCLCSRKVKFKSCVLCYLGNRSVKWVWLLVLESNKKNRWTQLPNTDIRKVWRERVSHTDHLTSILTPLSCQDSMYFSIIHSCQFLDTF